MKFEWKDMEEGYFYTDDASILTGEMDSVLFIVYALVIFNEWTGNHEADHWPAPWVI